MKRSAGASEAEGKAWRDGGQSYVSGLRTIPLSGARAEVVNRTHRVVRERARTIAVRRQHGRTLWIPLAVCSVLLLIISAAVWNVFDQYEVAPTGIPDASAQMLVLLLWFLPVSALLLVMVWFRRARIAAGNDPTS